MRKRPGGTIRILTHCARCGSVPPNYDVRRVVAFLPGRHEFVVCRHCDEDHASTPTSLEAAAMAIDDDPIATMRYYDYWHAEPGRVRRTAEFFLGAERYAELRPALVETRKAEDAEHDKYLERVRTGYYGSAAAVEDFFEDEIEEEFP